MAPRHSLVSEQFRNPRGLTRDEIAGSSVRSTFDSFGGAVCGQLSLRHQAEGNCADGEQGQHPLDPNRANDLKAGRNHHGIAHRGCESGLRGFGRAPV